MKTPTLAAHSFALGILVVAVSDTAAQQIKSPEVHSNGRVTVRLKSERAKSVFVEIAGNRIPLVKGDKNTWAATTDPLSAGIHEYGFIVDGTHTIDPSNRFVKKWFTLKSLVELPGDPPLITEFLDVPHGVVGRCIYPSKSIRQQRPVIIYTPPGYAPAADTTYPLIVLMHGFGDDETAWTEVGRAHLIADNLIAQGKLQPCIIAMPYGHPIPPPYGKRPENYFIKNNDAYERDMIEDLLPFLDTKYKLQRGPSGRSIAGLSMGGGHAIHIGLKHIEMFSAVGAFSAAAPQADKVDIPSLYPAIFGTMPKANQLKHFWIPIGKQDFLLDRNQEFIAILKKQGVNHEFTISDGGHSWSVWRKYLPEFLQMVLPAP